MPDSFTDRGLLRESFDFLAGYHVPQDFRDCPVPFLPSCEPQFWNKKAVVLSFRDQIQFITDPTKFCTKCKLLHNTSCRPTSITWPTGLRRISFYPSCFQKWSFHHVGASTRISLFHSLNLFGFDFGWSSRHTANTLWNLRTHTSSA